MFESRVMDGMYGLKRHVITEDEMGRTRNTNWKKRNAYIILVRRPGEKRPVGRQRRGLMDNIKMDFGEIREDGMDWTSLPTCST
jgi:hypothetical protein